MQDNDLCEKIAKRTSTRFCHDIFDKDDIYQEAYLICLESLQLFSPERGEKENFLARCVFNKLSNLRQSASRRSLVNECERLDSLDQDNLDLSYSQDSEFESFDDISKVADHLTAERRKDFLKYLAGVKITARRREMILEEFNGKKEGT
jgi:DNA-directed RNA polymerase specialized sigma24 family protein